MENIIYAINITPSKKLIKSSVFFLVIVTFFYVFSLGGIVNAVAQKKELADILEQKSQDLFDFESQISVKNALDMNLFLSLGYAESKKIEVIKTSRNVASLQASRN